MPEPAPHARLLRELLFVAFSADRRADPNVAARLTRSLGERRVQAGETVFSAGELPDRVYFMPEGRLRFTRPGSPDLVREGRWVLGLQEAVSMTPRRRTAVALGEARLLTVPAAAWLEILDDRADVARRMLIEIARANTAMHVRLAPDGGFPPVGPPACASPESGMNVVERLLFLGGVPLLAGAGVQALADLGRAADERMVAPGEALFERGAPRDRLHIVVSGVVEARHLEPRVTARFGLGDLVGGAVALGDTALSWEARAVEPSRVLSLPLDIWVDELEDHFALFRSAMAALVDEREDLLDRVVERTGEHVFR
jgi:CRP-like cAMP-binding protein